MAEIAVGALASAVASRALSGKAPAAQAAPPIPTIDQASIDRQAADMARKRKGIAANQLVGNTGPATVTTSVLGGG